MIAQLRALSAELMFCILEAGLSQRDLLCLCQIRGFHDVAQAILYRSFHGTYSNVRPFVRTILTQSKLAGYVQHVNLQNLCYLPPPSNRVRGTVVAFSRRVRSYSLLPVAESYWISELRRGHGEAFAGLLLTCLPNLRRLEVWAEDRLVREDRKLVPFTIFAKPFWTLAFPSLRVPSMVHGLSTYEKLEEIKLLSLPFSMTELSALFKLPSLKKLHAYDVFEPPEYAVLPRLQSKSSTIVELALIGATISVDTLLSMIHACSELHSFTFESPADDRARQAYSRLFEALESHKSSLEELYFREQNTPIWSTDSNFMLTLRPFYKLRKFIGDASVLYSSAPFRPLSTIMPKNIQKIRLHNVLPGLLAGLGDPRHILDDVTCKDDLQMTMFPNLRGVSLVHSSLYFDASNVDSLVDDLGVQGFFTTAGVELQIVDKFFFDLVESDCDADMIDQQRIVF